MSLAETFDQLAARIAAVLPDTDAARSAFDSWRGISDFINSYKGITPASAFDQERRLFLALIEELKAAGVTIIL